MKRERQKEIDCRAMDAAELADALKRAFAAGRRAVVSHSEEGIPWRKAAKAAGFRYYATRFEGWHGTDAFLYADEPLGLGDFYWAI